MKRLSVALFVGFAITNLCGSALSLQDARKPPRESQKSVNLTAAADKGVTSGDFKGGLQPQDPDGNAPVLWVSQLVWWEVNQVLLRFDLNALPRNMQVKSAMLELFVAELKGGDGRGEGEPTKVRVATLPPYDLWDEATADFQNRHAHKSWSNGELHRSTWKVLDTRTVAQKGVWVRWDVTEAVRAHHEGKLHLSGFLLQADYPMNHWGDLTNSPGKVGFYSKEADDKNLRPKLTVILTPLAKGKKLPPLTPPNHPSQLLRMPKPPFVIWYQCPFLDELQNCTVDASVGNIRWAFENHARGITSLMWVYGPNLYGEAKDWDTERFVKYYASYAEEGYAGIAMDEWNVGDDHPYVPMIAEALRQVKSKHPKFFIAVWVTHLTPIFRQLLKEGAIDLALIEGFTYVPEHPEWAISWDALIRERVELMKREGLLHKTIVCVGMVAAKPDSHNRRMTPEELSRQVEYLARHYPEMPGIAFYGYQDGNPKTRDLVKLADELAGKRYRRR